MHTFCECPCALTLKDSGSSQSFFSLKPIYGVATNDFLMQTLPGTAFSDMKQGVGIAVQRWFITKQKMCSGAKI